MDLYSFLTVPGIVNASCNHGVRGYVVDWERAGKHARQSGFDTQIGSDTLEDLSRVRKATRATVLCRVNAYHPQSAQEIESAIEGGADEVLLPMVRSVDEVRAVLEVAAGRVPVGILIETRCAVRLAPELARLPLSRVYIGLNDLWIDGGGLGCRFDPLWDGTVAEIRRTFPRIPLGVGGATVVDLGAPIPCRRLLEQYTRLGIDFTFLRRSYARDIEGRDARVELRALVDETASMRRGAPAPEIWWPSDTDEPDGLALVSYDASIRHRRALRAAAPRYKLAFAASRAEALALAPGADVLLGNRWLAEVITAATKARWIQSTSVGVDRWLPHLEGHEAVRLSRVVGLYDEEVAEHGIALLLALLRGLHVARDQQVRREWIRLPVAGLAGRRILVLGWGGIGRALARKVRGLGCQVAVARRGPGSIIDGFRVWGGGEWRQALERTEVLMMALPASAETRGIVGAAELNALPEGAVVVNVGRGETLDLNALLESLRTGKLMGAGLDVCDPEPLPAQHPAWEEPRLLITPHSARPAETSPFRWEGMVEENLRRFVAGEPILGEVDRAQGY